MQGGNGLYQGRTLFKTPLGHAIIAPVNCLKLVSRKTRAYIAFDMKKCVAYRSPELKVQFNAPNVDRSTKPKEKSDGNIQAEICEAMETLESMPSRRSTSNVYQSFVSVDDAAKSSGSDFTMPPPVYSCSTA